MADEPSFGIKVVRRVFQFISLLMPSLLAATGALGIRDSKNFPVAGTTNVSITSGTVSTSTQTTQAQQIFMGIYMVLFAFTLFFYELLQLLPEIPYVSHQFKKNLGFLYGPLGRGFYTLMVGVFSFGLHSPRDLAIATGVILAFWGAFTILLSFVAPIIVPSKEKLVL